MRGKTEGYSPLRFLLDEMSNALGVVADTDRERVRQIAQALGVPPPEYTGPFAVLDLYWYYLDEHERNE